MSIMDRDEEVTEEELDTSIEELASKLGVDPDEMKAIVLGHTKPSPATSAPVAKTAPATAVPKKTLKEVYHETFTRGVSEGVFAKADKDKYLEMIRDKMDRMPKDDAIRETISTMKTRIKKHGTKPTPKSARPKAHIPGVPVAPTPPAKYFYYLLVVAQETDGHASAGANFFRIPTTSIKTGYTFDKLIEEYIRDQVITDEDEEYTIKKTSDGWYVNTTYDTRVSLHIQKVSKFPYKLKESATIEWEFEAAWTSTD